MDNKQRVEQEALLREMARLSHDMIMVYNPTDKDYRVEWEGLYHIVPNRNKDMGFGRGKRELERFLARKFAVGMKDQLINAMGEIKGQEMIEKRRAEGKPDFLDKYFENREVWDKVPRTDDPKMMETIFDEIWLGIVRPYGIDEVDDEEKADGRIDPRSVEERLLEKMNRAYVPADEVVASPIVKENVKPIVNKESKDKLVSEVAQ